MNASQTMKDYERRARRMDDTTGRLHRWLATNNVAKTHLGFSTIEVDGDPTSDIITMRMTTSEAEELLNALAALKAKAARA